jgi:hypothetical protein
MRHDTVLDRLSWHLVAKEVAVSTCRRLGWKGRNVMKSRTRLKITGKITILVATLAMTLNLFVVAHHL